MSNKVTKRLNRKDVLTIPNALSFLRILMVPAILYFYCARHWYPVAVGMILFSAATDIADGWIARHFHMISDFGKFIDPVADKLTQIAMIVCLILENRWQLYALLGLFVVKEIAMFTVGSLVLRRTDTINSSKWHGKFATVMIYVVMLSIMVFRDLPEWGINCLLILCAGVMIFSLVGYLLFYAGILREHRPQKKA